MPHGYRKEKDSGGECRYCKTHNNGDQTTVTIEKAMNGRYNATVEDGGQRMNLGEFATKKAAEGAARNWMRKNPKGLQQPANGGVIPGMNGAQQSNDFFSY